MDKKPSTKTIAKKPGSTINDVNSNSTYQSMLSRLRATEGPLALDAERASGYRYNNDAYLLQLKKGQGDIHIIDPIICDDLSAITSLCATDVWIIHAADQDIECFRSLHLEPKKLYDTRIAAKLLNLPKLSLSGLCNHYLDIILQKKFSAVDWSTRPIPADWKMYAALDVEYLFEIYRNMENDFRKPENKKRMGWFQQECQALLFAPKQKRDINPWKKISGINTLKNKTEFHIAQRLWARRDEIGKKQNTAPKRVLSDKKILSLSKFGAAEQWKNVTETVNDSPHKSTFIQTIQQALCDARSGNISNYSKRKKKFSKNNNTKSYQKKIAILKEEIEKLCQLHTVERSTLISMKLIKAFCAKPPKKQDIPIWFTQHNILPWKQELLYPAFLLVLRVSDDPTSSKIR